MPKHGQRQRRHAKHKLNPNIPTIGSRAQVFHGNANHTSGYLYKEDLKIDKGSGQIVSKEASERAKERWPDLVAKYPQLRPKTKKEMAKLRALRKK